MKTCVKNDFYEIITKSWLHEEVSIPNPTGVKSQL